MRARLATFRGLDSPTGLPGIVLVRKGQEAIFAVTNYADTEIQARVTIDPAAMGFSRGYVVEDIETGNPVKVLNNQMPISIAKHDLKEFHLRGL